MTPEEIKSHKGEQLSLEQTLYRIQEKAFPLLCPKPIETLLKKSILFPIILLDSIFNSEIQKNIPHVTCRLNLCNDKGQILDSTHREYTKNQQIITVTHPIGTKDEFWHPLLSPFRLSRYSPLPCPDRFLSDDNHYLHYYTTN